MTNFTDVINNWRKTDKWKREGNNFIVEVTRHMAGFDDNVWCIYAYIYPDHPHFVRFDRNGNMWNQPHYGVHSYTSYFRAHLDYKTGGVTSFQIGWDYAHDGDSRYTQMSNPLDAIDVFLDASRLFDELSEAETLLPPSPTPSPSLCVPGVGGKPNNTPDSPAGDLDE